MKIRAHHLLCTRAFKGKGYSETFVNTMYDVIGRMKKGVPFSVITGTDAICAACSHGKGGVCDA